MHYDNVLQNLGLSRLTKMELVMSCSIQQYPPMILYVNSIL
jgi:hypothetical protein